MKRVRYLAGAAGLAPVAFGMTAPAAVPAAAVPAAAGHAKTVSLRHVLGSGAAPAAASAVSSASAVSPAATTDTGGCTGWTKIRRFGSLPVDGSVFYWAGPKNRCISTVQVGLYFTKGTATNPFCKSVTLDVSLPGGSRSPGVIYYYKTHRVCGTANHWVGTKFSVHKLIPVSVSFFNVIASSTYFNRASTTFYAY